MELSSGLPLQLVIVLLICKLNVAFGDEIPTSLHSDSIQRPYHPTTSDDYDTYVDKRSSLGTREFLRLVIMAFHSFPDGFHISRIPYRPVRRIGSEFLGKRSGYDPVPDLYFQSLMKRGKGRVLGSEFLGKRRLGSEFLGKRALSMLQDLEDDVGGLQSGEDDDEMMMDPSASVPFMMAKRRVLGSEFLGKRRVPSPYDWSWKRARLGSEFLGKKKRKLGSEFLGKRAF